ncbi:MAG: choice-of-anchor A family protein [Phaeodactylibacter sp.]|nr:choice-of-anchor A family protein [Phaeodactylibacter sp.]
MDDHPVYGNYRVANNEPGDFYVGMDAQPTSLLVNGYVEFLGGMGLRVNQNGYVKIGDCTGATIYNQDQNNASVNTRITGGAYNQNPAIQLSTQQPEASVCESDLLDFELAFTLLRANSYGIGECTTNVKLLDQNGNPITNTTGDFPPNMKIEILPDVVNVWDLSIDALNSIPNLTFVNQPTATSPLVINVYGEGGIYDWQPFNAAGIGGTVAPFILFNIIDVEALLVMGSNTVWGTILAPNSNVRISNPNNVEGQVVAMELLIMAGEVHHRLFEGIVPLCAVVPVNWLRFDATLQDANVLLSWSTANEKDNAEFVVEYSQDLSNWTILGTVEGRGTTDLEQHYFFEAPRPVGPEGYYRIQQVDYNGDYSYSPVRVLTMQQHNDTQWKVVPNPVQGSTQIILGTGTVQETPIELQLIDLEGKTLKQSIIPANTPSYELDLSDYSNGLYILKLSINDGTFYQKIVKE